MVAIGTTPPDDYVLIDEVETHLHSCLQKIWPAIDDFSRKRGVRIIATTRRVEYAKAIYQAYKEDRRCDLIFSLYRLERDREHDEIKAVHYDTGDLEALLGQREEIR